MNEESGIGSKITSSIMFNTEFASILYCNVDMRLNGPSF